MAEPALQARGLSKTYKQGEVESPVLKEVDFGVRAGEFVAVLGPSGSGKSTLLNVLGLMDAPTGGEVLVFGKKAAALPEPERCALRNRHIGFVFQFDSLLPEFTVLENVMMPGRIRLAREGGSLAEVEAAARELLGGLGIGSLADRFPQRLSGGERQRTAIARALINRPGILLADEPTGNLDRRNGESVFAKMRELAGGLGVAAVLVTHDEEAARSADRTIRLLDGRIQGEPATIRGSEGS